MTFNPGPLICSTSTAVIYSQKLNDNDEKVSSSSERTYIMTDYEPIVSTKEILEELKSVLEQETNKDENSISVYDVINLTRKKYEDCTLLNHRLCWYIRDKIDDDVMIFDSDYDAINKYLIIRSNGKIYFLKKDDELFIVKSESYKASDILCKCGDKISERYDKFIEDISFYRDYMENVTSTNSKFKISSDEYTIDVKYREFNLSAEIYTNEYKYDCNSNNVASVCRDKEDELLKKIFIKIEDSPEWMRSELYNIRREQLNEIQKVEEKEMKKQKRLELTRKIFPFLKK